VEVGWSVLTIIHGDDDPEESTDDRLSRILRLCLGHLAPVAQRISRSAARPVPRAEAVTAQVYAAPGSSAAGPAPGRDSCCVELGSAAQTYHHNHHVFEETSINFSRTTSPKIHVTAPTHAATATATHTPTTPLDQSTANARVNARMKPQPQPTGPPPSSSSRRFRIGCSTRRDDAWPGAFGAREQKARAS
jgi:hypothetical protein